MAKKIVRWIHVSDWHVTSPLDSNARDVLNGLIKDIEKNTAPGPDAKPGFSPDFVVHSGDIAFSGKSAQYKAARPYLQKLLAAAGLGSASLFVVPGNHDVDDQKAIDAGPLLLAKTDETYTKAMDEAISRPRLGYHLERFAAFCRAFAEFLPPSNRPSGRIPYYASRFETRTGLRIGVVGMNSAVFSRKDDAEIGRRMVLSRWQVNEAISLLEQTGPRDLNLAILHHPLSALTDYDYTVCSQILLSKFDLVLRGHLHDNTVAGFSTPTGHLCLLGAGSGYEKRWTSNKYLLVEANLESKELNISFRRWDPPSGQYVADSAACGGVSDHGTATIKLAPKTHAETSTPPVATPSYPLTIPNRLGHPLPRSGLETFGVFSGYFDRISQYQVADRIRHALSQAKVLHTKYLFWHVDSRRFYHDLVQDRQYTIANDSRSTFSTSVSALVQHLLSTWGETTYQFVSLGVGDGDKEKLLIGELLSRSDKARAVLLSIDFNYQMLQWAMNDLRTLCDERFQAMFCNSDFDRLADLGGLLPKSDGPLIFLFLGGLFGNQDEGGVLRTLRAVADDRCYLLTGVQLRDVLTADDSLAGYRTRSNRRFLEITLRAFDPQFDPKKHQIEPQLTTWNPGDVPEAETITMMADSPRYGSVALGFSRRYRKQELMDYLQAHGCSIAWQSESSTYWKVLAKLSPGLGRP